MEPHRSRVQVPAINQGLHDAHPYVRRTAVMGVMKVYNIDSGLVINTGTPRCIILLPAAFRPCVVACAHDLAWQACSCGIVRAVVQLSV